MNKRIREVRKYYHLTQEEFAQRIGLRRSSECLLETGRNHPTEQTILLICSEFMVDYNWLISGKGEMLSYNNNNLINEVAKRYNLTDEQKDFINKYLTLPANQRQQLVNLVSYLSNNN